jgi:RNA polymerase sigma-70 factor (ECF subfamily)
MAGNERVKTLVEDYGARAFRFAYSLTGNIEESRDLVSESFARALTHWDQYDARRPFENWFFAILHHLFLDATKRYDRRTSVSLDALIPRSEEVRCAVGHLKMMEEGVLERLEREENAKSVQHALEQLPWNYRAVLVLCDMEEMKYEEISKILCCPIGTVRSRINRARAALREILSATMRDATDRNLRDRGLSRCPHFPFPLLGWSKNLVSLRILGESLP